MVIIKVKETCAIDGECYRRDKTYTVSSEVRSRLVPTFARDATAEEAKVHELGLFNEIVRGQASYIDDDAEIRALIDEQKRVDSAYNRDPETRRLEAEMEKENQALRKKRKPRKPKQAPTTPETKEEK